MLFSVFSVKLVVSEMFFNRNKILNLLVLIFFFIRANAEWNAKDYMKREHSLVKPYQGSGMSIPFWDFIGSTMVTTNYVRITADQQSKSGAIWNSAPCLSRNWELQINFKISGKGKDLFGDGMAIWYAKTRMEQGPVFGNIDYFSGLAIILDTYSNHNGPHNHQHPYISAMVNNATLHYDHDRDGTHTQLAGCEAKVRNIDHDTHIAIRYENDILTVSTDFEDTSGWKPCLTVQGVQLPTGYYFGVSATTGDLSDNHDVISIKLYELDLPINTIAEEDRSQISPSALLFEPPRDHKEDPKPSGLSGLKIFLLMLVGAIALIACVVIGVMFYQKHKETKRKRFY